ncbi:MAG: hydrogenase formation protein HypD [Actinobacteria bacterium]|nr:hydrogenase formation protein HypD [Actinomycetota bacterium]
MKSSINFDIKKTLKNLKKTNDSLAGNGKAIPLNIMEVCGTHTMSIAKHGISQLLPENINLISGPGCPVCVTPTSDIDWIIEIIKNYDLTVFTFGDMVRVPGTRSSLNLEKSMGKRIKICYSPLDALDYAEKNPDEKVLFIAIGFETTIPLSAVIIMRAYQERIKNFFIFSTHKVIPPALEALVKDRQIKINGLLLPGHVSAIIGSRPYKFIADNYSIPCVISGFEPADILLSIYYILKQLASGKPGVNIEYARVVKPEGNPAAIKSIYEVFETADSVWRGIGSISNTGMELKKIYSRMNAKLMFPVGEIISREPSGCQCGNVLKGIKKPDECAKFNKSCTPDNPVGPCMVSSEGTCAAYFRYYRKANT